MEFETTKNRSEIRREDSVNLLQWSLKRGADYRIDLIFLRVNLLQWSLKLIPTSM